MRRMALKDCASDAPILETHGGHGRIFERCYFDRPHGVVIEKLEDKALHLAQQRPSWRVYCGDCVSTLAAGLAADVPFRFIDLDPYGSPYEILDALFRPGRAFADRVELVVNDGMRQKARTRTEWQVSWLRPVVEKYGVGIYAHYLECAAELVALMVARAGFRVASWTGWYAGHQDDMTHYWATLVRQPEGTNADS